MAQLCNGAGVDLLYGCRHESELDRFTGQIFPSKLKKRGALLVFV